MKNKASLLKLSICIALGLGIWSFGHLIDAPAKGWQIFSIFFTVIISFILKPYPMGMMVLMGLVTLVTTNTISMEESLTGYADTTVWLVVAAFLIAGGVISSGIGKRIALNLISWFGKSILGLAYSICGTELILGPVVPSNTARGGGIIAPIVNSISHSLGSKSDENPKKGGEFLTLIGAHANLITAAMFLTGMAANPLIAKSAKDIYGISFDWGTWAMGAIIPGLIGLILLPLIIYQIAKPAVKDTSTAQEKVKEDLKAMGVFQTKEWIMLSIMTLLLLLWSTKFLHGLSTTIVAWIGVVAILIFSVQKWSDIIKNDKAWDTLIWLGGLLTMASMLKTYGFIDWMVDNFQTWVAEYNGYTAIVLLALIYFYSMYLFSMLTAHIFAMVGVFLALTLSLDIEPLLAIGIFAYFSCLCGCLTYYSTGPVIIYFGLGYISSAKWFSTGLIISFFHLLIWLGIGSIWWKLIGWW